MVNKDVYIFIPGTIFTVNWLKVDWSRVALSMRVVGGVWPSYNRRRRRAAPFFYLATRRVCIARTMQWPNVCLSVRLSVRPSHAGILSKRILNFLSHSDSPTNHSSSVNFSGVARNLRQGVHNCVLLSI